SCRAFSPTASACSAPSCCRRSATRTSPGMRSRAGREVDLSAHESVASQRAAPRMTAAPAELAPTPPPPEAPLAYRLTRRVTEYARLMRLDRPVGTWLLLWPALWALWIAGSGRPRPQVLGVFVLGVVVMRAAGCVINDFLDRDIDPHVQRTRDRPLAARRVSPLEALLLFALLLAVALYLVTRLDLLTVQLAAIGALLTVSYPRSEEHTSELHSLAYLVCRLLLEKKNM